MVFSVLPIAQGHLRTKWWGRGETEREWGETETERDRQTETEREKERDRQRQRQNERESKNCPHFRSRTCVRFKTHVERSGSVSSRSIGTELV